MILYLFICSFFQIVFGSPDINNATESVFYKLDEDKRIEKTLLRRASRLDCINRKDSLFLLYIYYLGLKEEPDSSFNENYIFKNAFSYKLKRRDCSDRITIVYDESLNLIAGSYDMKHFYCDYTCGEDCFQDIIHYALANDVDYLFKMKGHLLLFCSITNNKVSVIRCLNEGGIKVLPLEEFNECCFDEFLFNK